MIRRVIRLSEGMRMIRLLDALSHVLLHLPWTLLVYCSCNQQCICEGQLIAWSSGLALCGQPTAVWILTVRKIATLFMLPTVTLPRHLVETQLRAEHCVQHHGLHPCSATRIVLDCTMPCTLRMHACACHFFFFFFFPLAGGGLVLFLAVMAVQ